MDIFRATATVVNHMDIVYPIIEAVYDLFKNTDIKNDKAT